MVFCTWLCKGKFFLLPFPTPFFLSSPLYDIEWPVPPALPLAPTPMLWPGTKWRVWWPLACLLLGSLHLSLDLATPQCSYGVWETSPPRPTLQLPLLVIPYPHPEGSPLTCTGQSRAISVGVLGKTADQATWWDECT